MYVEHLKVSSDPNKDKANKDVMKTCAAHVGHWDMSRDPNQDQAVRHDKKTPECMWGIWRWPQRSVAIDKPGALLRDAVVMVPVAMCHVI